MSLVQTIYSKQLSGILLAATILGSSSQAEAAAFDWQTQSEILQRWAQWLRPRPEHFVQVCALSYQDNRGLWKETVWRPYSRYLVKWAHYVYVQDQENCKNDIDDDCNGVVNDGCEPAPVCGDGVVHPELREECDDGNLKDGDGCDAKCKREPVCGDGMVNQPKEECDQGERNGSGKGCTKECKTHPYCGNGKLDLFSGELCDRGELNGTDQSDCDAKCRPRGFEERLALFPFKRKAGEDCETCMSERCARHVHRCFKTTGCIEGMQCPARNSCLDPKTGPLGCLCGDGESPVECLKKERLQDLQGACVSEFAAGLGGSSAMELFRSLANQRIGKGQAYATYTCMQRSCATSCDAFVDKDPDAPSVCGNGILEKGERCDTVGSTDCSGEDTCVKGEEPQRPPSPVCGNGVVEKGELCDTRGATDCTSKEGCKIEELAVPAWSRGTACGECMWEYCATRLDDCLGDPACERIARCETEKGCIDRFLGPLSCLCGVGVTVPECQKVKGAAFEGPCASEILEGLGSPDKTRDAVARFGNDTWPAGRANRATICQARYCRKACSPSS